MLSKHMLHTIVVSIVLLHVPEIAVAQTASFSLGLKDGKWKCEGPPKPGQTAPTPEDSVVIIGKVTGTTTAQLDVKAAYTGKDAKPHEVVLAKSAVPNTVTLSGTVKNGGDTEVDRKAPITLKGKVDNVDVDTASCTLTLPAAEAQPGPRPGPTTSYSELDYQALEWLGSDTGRAALAEWRERLRLDYPKVSPSEVFLLVHTPSGAQATGGPTSVSERQFVQVLVILDEDAPRRTKLSFTKCEAVPTDRLRGDFGSLAGQLQTSLVMQPSFRLQAIGPLTQCGAPDLKYDMSVQLGAEEAVKTSTTIEVRPVYTMGAVGAIGWDGTRSIGVDESTGTIEEKADRTGPGNFLVGVSFYPGGLDTKDMRWFNRFLNPTLLVRPKSPAADFVIGLSGPLVGGVSVIIGAAIHKGTILKAGKKLHDPVAAKDDSPTERNWSKVDKGLYLGLAIDTALLANLSKLKK